MYSVAQKNWDGKKTKNENESERKWRKILYLGNYNITLDTFAIFKFAQFSLFILTSLLTTNLVTALFFIVFDGRISGKFCVDCCWEVREIYNCFSYFILEWTCVSIWVKCREIICVFLGNFTAVSDTVNLNLQLTGYLSFHLP